MDNDRTQHGFSWGPLDVTRIFSVDDKGYLLEITTEHRCMQVWVSWAGRVIRACPVHNNGRKARRKQNAAWEKKYGHLTEGDE